MKNIGFKNGVLISLIISILTASARIFRLNTFDVNYFIGHLLYAFLLTLLFWLICHFFAFKQLKLMTKLVLCLVVCGYVSILFHFGIQTLFKFISIDITDFPVMTDLSENKQKIMLFFRGIVFGAIIYFIIYYLNSLDEKQQTQLELQELKQHKLEAQLNTLKQQISPHFLFNSLSTLKTIVTETSSKKYIQQLSNVYRYLLSISENQVVLLSEELEFIKSYSYIMQERFEEALEIKITINQVSLDKLIPPLTLQLLIENAIKHNVVSLENPLIVEISTISDDLMIIKNNLNPKHNSDEGNKVGLENINKRYDLLVGKTIEIKNANGFFCVTIPLINDKMLVFN